MHSLPTSIGCRATSKLCCSESLGATALQWAVTGRIKGTLGTSLFVPSHGILLTSATCRYCKRECIIHTLICILVRCPLCMLIAVLSLLARLLRHSGLTRGPLQWMYPCSGSAAGCSLLKAASMLPILWHANSSPQCWPSHHSQAPP